MSSVRPLLPTQHLHSQCGGRGSWKGKEQEEGLGQQEFKTNNKNRIKKEERKKKTNNQKARSSGADSTRKEKQKKQKTKKIHFWKKRKKRKKVLCTFSKFCGETSRYWALFSKISNSLICFKYVFLHFTGFFEIIAMFQLCHQFANFEIFFLNVCFVPN